MHILSITQLVHKADNLFSSQSGVFVASALEFISLTFLCQLTYIFIIGKTELFVPTYIIRDSRLTRVVEAIISMKTLRFVPDRLFLLSLYIADTFMQKQHRSSGLFVTLLFFLCRDDDNG